MTQSSRSRIVWFGAIVALTAFTIIAPVFASAFAEESQAELAKKLNNPVANLISVPLQSNWDFGIGPAEDAMRYTLNIQPVIPISISTDWNLITRTILPVIYAESPMPGGPNKGGLGDTIQSLFLSPKAPVGGIVGAGPVFLWPTATNGLGSQQWGVGPTIVVLRQEHGWTYGLLANQIWSYTGHENSTNVSSAFLQPFASYTTKSYTTLTVNTESSVNWKAPQSNQQWTVPVNVMVSQLLKIGGRPISFQLGGRAYADRPPNGPNWGMRFAVFFLFPK